MHLHWDLNLCTFSSCIFSSPPVLPCWLSVFSSPEYSSFSPGSPPSALYSPQITVSYVNTRVHRGCCPIVYVNLSITITNKEGLRVDPRCNPTPTLNPSVTPTDISQLSHGLYKCIAVPTHASSYITAGILSRAFSKSMKTSSNCFLSLLYGPLKANAVPAELLKFDAIQVVTTFKNSYNCNVICTYFCVLWN